jgi:His-Xaa-Ser system radical SAM maturase HxsB
MAFSITSSEILNREHVPFRYNTARISDENLVVADHGKWVMMSDEELDLLENGIIENDSALFHILEEKGIILTLKNEERITDFYRKLFGFLSHGAALHILVVTNACTHNCIYCHASPVAENSKRRKLMSKETAKKAVDFAFQSPSRYITLEFQGGEPLINFEVIKFVVEYANEKNKTEKKNLLFRLVTNLQLMDEEKLDFLVKNNVSICTSLDGPEELHNSNRAANDRNFNSYENIIRWVKKIQERCRAEKLPWDISALVTITRKSMGMHREIIDEYVKNGFTKIFIRSLNRLGLSRKNHGNIGYSAEEFIDFWKKCADYITKLNESGILITESMMWVILSKILTDMDPNYVDMRSPCGAGISQIAYDHEGNIHCCDLGRTVEDDIFCIGNVNQKYSDVFGSSNMPELVSASILDTFACAECPWKPFCGTCPVFTFGETNSMIQNGHDFKCRLHAAQFEYIFGKIKDTDFQEKIIKKWFSLKSD